MASAILGPRPRTVQDPLYPVQPPASSGDRRREPSEKDLPRL